MLLLHHGDKKTVTKARRVIIGIGRSGNHRKLGVPGEEDLDKVFNRLYDPKEFAGQKVLVVGGGDSALETTIALATSGAHVTLSYRKKEFARPKQENIEKIQTLQKNPSAAVAVEHPSSERVTTSTGGFMAVGEHHAPGSVRLAMATQVVRVEAKQVVLKDETGKEMILPNDVVFTMLGREAPLEFFRRSGIPIRGEWSVAYLSGFAAFLLACLFLYNWKAGGTVNQYFQKRELFPYNTTAWFARAGGSVAAAAKDPKTVLGTLAISLKEPGFYYSFAYCLCVLLFGIARIRRRKTPYVTRQTVTLTLVQWIPLFLLPYLVLPLLGHNGVFDSGFGKTFADHLFPAASYGQGREYWRAFGFILAWPLFIWNVFSSQPMWWWLAIAFVQTFVIIPLIIRRWGKGAYCGWICSCGALAETMGDTQRQKMPHGPLWNRVNMTGQVVLAAAFLIFFARVLSWSLPNSGFGRGAQKIYDGLLSGWHPLGLELNYYHGGDRRRRLLLLVLGSRLVPLRLSARGAYAHLRAFLEIPDLRREIQVHLVQRLHVGLPPGHRHHELRQQGNSHGGPGVRALLSVRPVLSDRRPRLRALRRHGDSSDPRPAPRLPCPDARGRQRRRHAGGRLSGNARQDRGDVTFSPHAR